MASPVYADLVRPSNPRLAFVFDASLVAGFSLLIALSAQIAIPLPFTPVPVTLQTFAVVMTGFLLGRGRGTIAAAAYIAEGSIGLPFFSGGTSGIAHLLGPTGGYLLGCVAASFVAGLFAERAFSRKWLGLLVALVIADLTVFVPGVIWLGAFVGMQKSVVLGFIPFAVGDALKVAVAWGILEAAGLIARKPAPAAERGA